MNYKLLIIFLLGATQNTFAQKNFLDQPYIEIISKVDTLVVPDRIFLSIKLRESDSKNKKAVEDQEQIMEQVLKNLKIDTEKNLSLSDAGSNFKSYTFKGKQVVKSKNYIVMVSTAVMAGKIMGALENEGISNVSIDHTEYSKTEKMISLLKAKAVKKAYEEAQLLSKTLNKGTVQPVHISDVSKNYNQLNGTVRGIVVRGYSKLSNTIGNEPIEVEFEKIPISVEINTKFIF